MNIVQTVVDRQLGLYSRVNYDTALRRLAVAPEESFHGLSNVPGGGGGTGAGGEQDPPMFACRFAEEPRHAHVLAIANEDGRVAIQDTSVVSPNTTLEGFQCHNNAVFDLAWRPGYMNFVTVSGDHTASLWDIETGACRRLMVFSQHSRSVKTCAFPRAQPALFCTGARDGHVLLWDVRAPPAPAQLVLHKPDNSLLNCHAAFTPKTPGSHSKRARLDQHRATSITGLLFQDDQTLISCGECDGNIKVWDLRKNYNVYKREPLPKHSIPYCGSSTKNGFTNLVMDGAGRRLYASCMDNVIYCFNVSTYSTLPEQRYIGHENSTFYIKSSLSPDDKYLVSGSSDKNAYIWNVKYSQPVVRLAGHWAEVTCAAWGPRGDTKLVTCSDDARHKIWRVGREYLEPHEDTELQGRAELVPRAEIASLPQWGALDTTPRSVKRKAALTPGSYSAKRAKAQNTAARKSKRCLADMMGLTRDGEEPVGLRLCTDAPEPLLTTPTKFPRLDTGPQSSHADLTYFLPKPGPSFASPTKSDEWIAKTPVSRSSKDACTPVKVSPESPKVRIITIKTPTKNLPNFVLDGEAPHLRLMSPAKKRPRADTVDWLTQLRLARPALPPAPAPAPAPADEPGPPPPPPPRRNSTVDRQKPGHKTRTLLKYFNVSAKEK